MPTRITYLLAKRASSNEIYSLSPPQSISEAARYLKEKNIRAAAVLNLDRTEIIGVLSHSDISTKVVAENYHPSKITVGRVMSEPPIIVSPDTLIPDAEKLMVENNIHHLVVTNNGTEKGSFLGLISRRDIDGARADMERERANLYKDYAFPPY